MNRSLELTKRIFGAAISLLLIAALAVFILYAKSRVGAREAIAPDLQARLDSLGMLALAGGDVPVSSVILYSGAVIAEGFNTVARDSNAAGHAEINALTDALRTMGLKAFSSLDRDSLILISTFEPCPMCRGALQEYRISRVEYLKAKPVFYLLGTDIRLLFFHWSKEFRGPEALQDSLFARHPSFTRPR